MVAAGCHPSTWMNEVAMLHPPNFHHEDNITSFSSPYIPCTILYLRRARDCVNLVLDL
jgi:hypothetical protein